MPTFWIWKTQFSDNLQRCPYATASVCPQTQSGRAVPVRCLYSGRTVPAQCPHNGHTVPAQCPHNGRKMPMSWTQNGRVSNVVFHKLFLGSTVLARLILCLTCVMFNISGNGTQYYLFY